ncbi:MAG TPA: DUF1993 domain-containing protein [Caulobacteraceae bacterium]|nr:DUF1993 domain-containing protein [Caulobacteraceae bacterium]
MPVTISMYAASAPVLVQALKGVRIVIDKAEAYARARKVDEAVLLQARIFPDMFPFVRQCQIVTDNAKGCVARLSGQTPPSYEDTEASFEALRARIDKTIAYVESFTPEQLDGSEDRDVVLKFPNGQMEFKGQSYLLGFVLPNVFFHAATAYDLMRQAGVELTKGDYMGRS